MTAIEIGAERRVDIGAERRAAPKPARIPSGDRLAYSLAEGLHFVISGNDA